MSDFVPEKIPPTLKVISYGTEIMNEVWQKPSDGAYYFKKAHAIAYAHAILVQMNLIVEQAVS